jgi:hypothetical protein
MDIRRQVKVAVIISTQARDTGMDKFNPFKKVPADSFLHAVGTHWTATARLVVEQGYQYHELIPLTIDVLTGH